MNQIVPDTKEKNVFSTWDRQAWPAWSLVSRWTDPGRNWGCMPQTVREFSSGDGSPSPHSAFSAQSVSHPIHIDSPDGFPHQSSGDGSSRRTQRAVNSGYSSADRAIFSPRETPSGQSLTNNPQRAGAPRYLPINVYLGETLDGKTGRPTRSTRSTRSARSARSTRPTQPTQSGAHSRNAAKIDAAPKKRSLKGFLKGATITLLIAGFLVGGWFAVQVVQLNQSLPALPARPAATMAEGSVILASDGSELGTLFGERRMWVPLDEVSPLFVQALIAAEDHRFNEHSGVDWVRMAGAFWSTATGDPEGASTIPMQLARNYFPELK